VRDARLRALLTPARRRTFRALSKIEERQTMTKRKNRVMLSSAIDECQQEVHELSEEMREAFEGTPEVFQDTAGRPREEAADRLEVAYDFLRSCDGIPEALRNEEVEWIEMRAGTNGKIFRPARRDNVVRCLQSCVWLLSAAWQNDETTKLKTDWQHAIDILRTVYFPGMTARRAA
jgi:hypothetical protein